MWYTPGFHTRTIAFSHICKWFKEINQITVTLLDPIMFANDTNLFYWNKHMKDLFERVSKELQELQSLNAVKTKYLFFHKKEHVISRVSRSKWRHTHELTKKKKKKKEVNCDFHVNFWNFLLLFFVLWSKRIILSKSCYLASGPL